MSEFWNNNKDTIGAGLKTVGKYSYKSTKFVAKTGYQAGKSHYQNSKAKREGRTQEGSDDSGQTTPNVHINYKDPSAFPPPPVNQDSCNIMAVPEILLTEVVRRFLLFQIQTTQHN